MLPYHYLLILSMNRLLEILKIGPVFSYFLRVFRKPDPNHPTNINLRMMHGINRISIVMFLFCIIVMIVRACTR
jgi:hypothetical protein